MLLLKYSLFAGISTLFNLLFQYMSFSMYTGFASIYLALFIGTFAGLVVKYLLDKNFIFYHVTTTQKENVKNFGLYSLMGIFTTMIFWGTEIGFDTVFEDENAKYIGGLIGLAVGYVIKYFLDKKYVFVTRGVA
ncbi:MAG: GtrA family protein [Sulfurovum sp.]|nr:MAG: GtrA family protein [Sulfurovum sp.]